MERMGTPTLVCVWSCPNFSAPAGRPFRCSKRVKRPAKKSIQDLARGVVIRETPEIPVSKKKEKVDVARGKGIELLSDVALKEDDQFEEVQRKSMRDFYKTHPSGSGTPTKPTPSAAIIKPSVTNEGTGVKPGVLDVTKEESSKRSDQEKESDDDKTESNNENESDSEHETNEFGSESDQEKDDEKIQHEEEEEEKEIVKTPSNDSDDEDETKIADKA
ncbi:hypothetical protein Tco_1067151 [Tanacetum coccineum]|uniref:Uncharacterized protein n=1 Tax=Tanacetum coccineum TaxID=301880 RepID=A0ABQ5HC20_9ASTR